MTAIHLINPKTPHNVGGALRACAVFGAKDLTWTGERVTDGREPTRSAGTSIGKKGKWRLPREERLRHYDFVDWRQDNDALDAYIQRGLVPVCVERMDATPLPYFEHPEQAVYIFGPEDGDVPKGIRVLCHDFIRIPGDPAYPHADCLNLAAAVNVVLYDRRAKETLLPRRVPLFASTT